LGKGILDGKLVHEASYEMDHIKPSIAWGNKRFEKSILRRVGKTSHGMTYISKKKEGKS